MILVPRDTNATASPLPTAMAESSRLSSGAIAGIVVSVVAGVVAFLTLCFFFCRRIRKSRLVPLLHPGPAQEVKDSSRPPAELSLAPGQYADTHASSPTPILELGFDDSSYNAVTPSSTPGRYIDTPTLYQSGVTCPAIPASRFILIRNPKKADADPVRSCDSGVTAVDPGSPAQRTTGKSDHSKRILGLDDRTFLEALPRLEAEQSSRSRHISSATDIGIDPWAVEYRPNSVIFPHLSAVLEEDVARAQTSQTATTVTKTAVHHTHDLELGHAARTKLLEGLEELENLARNGTDESRSAVGSMRILSSKNPWKSNANNQTIFNESLKFSVTEASPSSDDPSGSRSQDIAEIDQDRELEGEMLAEVESDLYSMPTKQWVASHSALNLNFTTSEISPNFQLEHQHRDPMDLDAVRSSTESSHTTPAAWHSSPASVSTAPSSQVGNTIIPKEPHAKIDIPTPSISPVSVVYAATPEYPCPDPHCNLVFRTPGQRKNHHNRKHNLRYICTFTHCESAFGLRADLERHKRTVHRATLKINPEQLHRCTNPGCATPNKTYPRKDNYNRHVKRCLLAAEKTQSTKARP